MLESVLVWPPASALSLTSNYTCAPAAVSPGHKIWWSCASLSLHKYKKCNKYQVFLPQKFSQLAGSVQSAKDLRLGTISRECEWVVPVLLSELCIPQTVNCCLLQEPWYCRSCRKQTFRECLVLWERLVSDGVNQKDFIFETTVVYVLYKFCH